MLSLLCNALHASAVYTAAVLSVQPFVTHNYDLFQNGRDRAGFGMEANLNQPNKIRVLPLKLRSSLFLSVFFCHATSVVNKLLVILSARFC